MQIVSSGNNLDEFPKPIIWEMQDKYFKMSSAKTFYLTCRAFTSSKKSKQEIALKKEKWFSAKAAIIFYLEYKVAAYEQVKTILILFPIHLKKNNKKQKKNKKKKKKKTTKKHTTPHPPPHKKKKKKKRVKRNY